MMSTRAKIVPSSTSTGSLDEAVCTQAHHHHLTHSGTHSSSASDGSRSPDVSPGTSIMSSAQPSLRKNEPYCSSVFQLPPPQGEENTAQLHAGSSTGALQPPNARQCNKKGPGTRRANNINTSAPISVTNTTTTTTNNNNNNARAEKKRAWAHIPHPGGLANGTLAPGHTLDLYDGHLTQYYCVPSEDVYITHGSIRYVEHFNECGPYTRFRFQICHNFLAGRCSKGQNCTYVHVRRLPECCHLHINGVDTYERLPPGGSLLVHWPHSTQQPQCIPTEFVLYTEGAAKAMAGTPMGANFRPQHCAHYQFKKLCNRGYSCNFIHSLIMLQ